MLTNGEGKEHVINQKGYRQKQYQSALQPLGPKSRNATRRVGERCVTSARSATKETKTLWVGYSNEI